jgi:hypothetical protein
MCRVHKGHHRLKWVPRCRWPVPQLASVGALAAQVRMNLQNGNAYDVRRAAYDLKKLRGKGLITRVGKSRRYTVPPQALRAIAALVLLREKVIRPILAGTAQAKIGRKPKNWSPIDATTRRSGKTWSRYSRISEYGLWCSKGCARCWPEW